MSDYRIVLNGGVSEIVEKKSRFIATVRPIASEEEAFAMIDELKKQYWDASHNCSAYTIGPRHETVHCSDDGEPAKTAGRPMLDVLLGEDIHDTCVVVTRYFGGTLLGTGGLVRAYQAATKAGLSASRVVLKKLGFPLTITTDYNSIGKLLYLVAQNELTTRSTEYTDVVTLKVLAPESVVSAFCKDVTEATAGKAVIQKEDSVWFCESDGQILTFFS